MFRSPYREEHEQWSQQNENGKPATEFTAKSPRKNLEGREKDGYLGPEKPDF